MRNVKSFVFGLVSLVGALAVYVGLALTPFENPDSNNILKFTYIISLVVFFILPIAGLVQNRGLSAGLGLCILSLVIQVLMILLAVAC